MTEVNEELDQLEDCLQRWSRGNRRARKEALAHLDLVRQTLSSDSRPQAELATLYEISRELNSILDLNHLLEFILDRAVTLAQAERGFLVLYDPEEDGFEIAVARRFSAGEVDNAQVEVSHALIRRVMASREPVITTNAQEDPRFEASQSIIAYQIRSVLAVPLETQEELVGAIYVDTRLSARLFTPNDLDLLKALADQAATAIRITRLYENLQAKNVELEATLQELQDTQNELIRAERLSVVGRMASAIIHDLKNPMTTIKGFADLLGRDNLEPETRKRFSKKVTHAIDGFVGMTQEILDYARGGSELNRQVADVADFVTDIVSFIEPEFSQHGIEIKTKLGYTGPLVIDRDKLWRVFMNIAQNARDALANGGAFMITSQSLGDEQVEFWLADNGPGIPREIQDKLFEPFVTHGKQYGTGLGLAISRKIVEDHGGRLAVQSRRNQGACFIIRLPIGPVEACLETPEEADQPHTDQAESAS